MGQKIAILALLLMLAACATTSGGTFCDIARAQRPSEATLAVMTDAEIDEMLSHNRKGERLCGWKP